MRTLPRGDLSHGACRGGSSDTAVDPFDLDATAPTNLARRFNQVVDPASIKAMDDQGLKITINSDDPTFLATSTVNEYMLAAQSYDFNVNDIKRFVLNSIDGAWLDDSTQRQWRQDWGLEIDQLAAAVVA